MTVTYQQGGPVHAPTTTADKPALDARACVDRAAEALNAAVIATGRPHGGADTAAALVAVAQQWRALANDIARTPAMGPAAGDSDD